MPLDEGVPRPCELTTSFGNADLAELFSSGRDTLVTDFDVLDLSEELRAALSHQAVQPLAHLSQLDHFDRLLIFTDGSSIPAMRRYPPERADELGHPDAWSFVVVAEKYHMPSPGNLTVLGWTAQPVRYTPGGKAYTGITRTGSDMAERSALIGAAMWRLSINHGIHTVFCSDSAQGGGQAQGRLGTADQDQSYDLLRGLFQALELALPGDRLAVHHVSAHAGELFNEIADVAAKGEARSSFNLPRQNLDMNQWTLHFRQLWTVFGHHCGLPHWQGGTLAVDPPSLPTQVSAVQVTHQTTEYQRWLSVDFFCSFATANVQSLFRGPQGHGGKLQYLQAQMRSFKLNFLAIQEARSESGLTSARNILRFSSGHDKGQYGIEVWCDLDVPYGRPRGGPPLHFKKDDFQVIHADPRKMLIRCDSGAISFWLFAGHAPHSGYPSDQRKDWWQAVHQLFHHHLDNDPLILLMDANASPGERDDVVVLGEGFATSANTSAFRDLLATWNLYLPTTSSSHDGHHTTWTSVDGRTEHCIDHVALPQQWQDRCTLSKVLSDFDLATAQEDHAVAAVQVEWKGTIPAQASMQRSSARRGRAHYRPSPDMKEKIENIAVAPWTTDVETQTNQLVEQLHQVLHVPGGTKHSAQKPYMDENIWTLRQNKLLIKKRLRGTRKQLGRQWLWTCFRAWSRTAGAEPSTPDEFSEVSQYITTLLCCQTKLVVQLRQISYTMKKDMQRAKQKAIHEEIVQQAHLLPATDLLRRLRRFIGPSNPQKKRTAPLPMIQNEEGEVCELPSEAVSVWARFFQTMEGGQRMSIEELRARWIAELNDFQQAHIKLELDQLPSLTDVEMALRRVPAGRACGPDGLPGELCKHHAPALAKKLYSTLVKILVHGHEPLTWKGGKLTPAYKGKGPSHQCSSYRSLLVSNHLGKAVHRSIRQRFSGLFEAFLQAQQTGGRKRIPVSVGGSPVESLSSGWSSGEWPNWDPVP